jgi:hypothetical protein
LVYFSTEKFCIRVRGLWHQNNIEFIVGYSSFNCKWNEEVMGTQIPQIIEFIEQFKKWKNHLCHVGSNRIPNIPASKKIKFDKVLAIIEAIL